MKNKVHIFIRCVYIDIVKNLHGSFHVFPTSATEHLLLSKHIFILSDFVLNDRGMIISIVIVD